MSRASSLLVLGLILAEGCSRPPPSGEPATGRSDGGTPPGPLASASASTAPLAGGLPPGASPCAAASPTPCWRIPTEAAFKHILAKEPLVLAIGEAHAARGTEAIASSTKRFTESLLPLAAPNASDVVVELWAPDPKCMKEVKQVASAQKPVTETQAATNQNEYVTLGTKAKEQGMTPWLLRPTCDDFAELADAGADSIGAMLSLVKRLTLDKVLQLLDRNRSLAIDAGTPDKRKIVMAYGGALHNDLAPPEASKEWSFGPQLDAMTNRRYIELDLIVPEYVQKTPVWEKLPWFAAFEKERAAGPRDEATVYVLGERSFVLVFPDSKATK